MKKILSITLLFFLASSVLAQTPRFIRPSETDNNIDKIDNFHVVYPPASGVETLNKLLIFLPGTFGQSAGYRFFMEEAAMLGYHVMGLQYVNDQLVNGFYCAGSMDPQCSEKVRREIIFGDDLHPDVEVNKANSLLNRAHKLLAFLDDGFSSENWGQFLVNDSLVFNKTAFAGHSQGGGHSAYIGTQFSVDRIIMMGSVDASATLGILGPWQNPNGATPNNKYFAFAHEDDEVAPYNVQQAGWQAFQMAGANTPLNIDALNSFPNDINCFFSQATPNTDPNAFHAATTVNPNVPIDAMGNLLYSDIWNFMLGKELSNSAIACISNPIPADAAINFCTNGFLSWDDVSGVLGYRISLLKIVNGVDSIVIENEEVTDNRFDFLDELDANTTYRWIAIPFDANSSGQNCDTLTFITTAFASPVSLIGVSSDSVCVGDSIFLTAEVFGGNRPFAYDWSLPVTTISANEFGFVTDDAGAYTINLTTTDDFGCSNISDDLTLNVFDFPEKSTISYTETVLIANANAANYQWYLNGNILNGETNKTFTHNKVEGSYTVVVFNEANCASDISEAYILSTVGIKQNGESVLNIYPNPCKGVFSIDANIDINSITLSDFSGKKMNLTSINKNTFNTNCKAGVYILKVNTSNGYVYSHKVIVE